jgi:hypothetical protein
MMRNRLFRGTKSKNTEKPNQDLPRDATKIKAQKSRSTNEFLKGYDSIWQAGPQVKFQNLGNRERIPQQVNQNPTLW